MHVFPSQAVKKIFTNRPLAGATHIVMIFDRSEISASSLTQCVEAEGAYEFVLREGKRHWESGEDDYLAVLLTEHGLPFVSSAQNISQLIDVVMPEVCLKIVGDDGKGSFAAIVHPDSRDEISTRLSDFLCSFDADEEQNDSDWEPICYDNVFLHAGCQDLVSDFFSQAGTDWLEVCGFLPTSDMVSSFTLANGDLKIFHDLPDNRYVDLTIPAFMWERTSPELSHAVWEMRRKEVSLH